MQLFQRDLLNNPFQSRFHKMTQLGVMNHDRDFEKIERVEQKTFAFDVDERVLEFVLKTRTETPVREG